MGSDPQSYECDAIDPNNPSGAKIKIVIPHPVYLRYYKYSSVRYANLRCVKWVLENTERIFTGLRLFNRGGWCYTGKPEKWCVREGVEAPFPDNKVFSVYVEPNFHFFESRSDPADANDPMSPVGWQDRFEGLIWKNTS